jgi:hypothetical protein
VNEGETGRLKAVNVSSPGGAPVAPPPRRPRRSNNVKEKQSKKKEPKEREPRFHDCLLHEVKQKIKDRQIDVDMKSTVDVAVGDLRIKLGQGGYAGFAASNGTVAEGTYLCDEQANVTFVWEHVLTFAEGEWKPGDANSLISSLSLIDGMYRFAVVSFHGHCIH